MPRPRNVDKVEYHTRRAQQEKEILAYILKNNHSEEDIKQARKRKKYHESMVK